MTHNGEDTAPVGRPEVTELRIATDGPDREPAPAPEPRQPTGAHAPEPSGPALTHAPGPVQPTPAPAPGPVKPAPPPAPGPAQPVRTPAPGPVRPAQPPLPPAPEAPHAADTEPPHAAEPAELPQDRSQAILEAAKHIGALLKRAGHPFALAGSVAVYAHGGSRYLQHDADFAILPDDAEAVAATLREAGLGVRTPPEDWLLKTTSHGQNVDIIFALAHRPVTRDMLERAHVLPVDSVLMPVLSPTDLIQSLIHAFSEHYCDFGSVLPVARAVREKVDWDAVRAACGDEPMPAAFLFLLERLNVIEPREGQP